MDAQGRSQEINPSPDANGRVEGSATHPAPIAYNSSTSFNLKIAAPSARDESYLFDLIGRIDHKVLCGDALYVQIQGIAYKILYGVYWRSVYSDQQFWGLRCEEIERGMWEDGSLAPTCVDLAIHYTEEGWTVEDQSLQLLLYRDLPLFENVTP